MQPEYLYHYTDVISYVHIVKKGFIDTTCSNLLPPDEKTARVEWNEETQRYCYRDKNDGYKPVVWLTEMETPDIYGLGLIDAKCGVRLKVKNSGFIDWKSFADVHHMDREWRKDFEMGRKPDAWYVSDHRIPCSDFIEVALTEEANEMLEEMYYSMTAAV